MAKAATKTADIEETITTALPSGTEMKVPLSKIVANKDFNARKFLPEAAIKEMASSLKREGQLAPVRVAPRSDGKYDLIYGFRRFEAAKLLKWDAIIATVDQSGGLAQRDRMVQNLVENEARQDLTTYERALRYKEMVDLPVKEGEKAITQGQLAAMTHKTQGYVSRLISGVEKLHAKLVTRWKTDCEAEVSNENHTSLITMTTLKELIKYDHEAQLKWLDEQINGKGEEEDDSEEGGGEEGEGPNTDPRTSTRNIRAAIIAAEAAKKDAKTSADIAHVDGVLEGLKYALKLRKIDKVLTIKEGKPCFVGDGKQVPVPRK